MPYTPGMYPNYNNMYGNYGQSMQTPIPQMQNYAPQMTLKGEIEWVDGEAAAKSYQIPAGMTKPIALWDTNDTVIYLKSSNAMGMPNPIQKIHYTMEDNTKAMSREVSRLESGEEQKDMSDYVKKDDLKQMKEELMKAIENVGSSAITNATKRTGKGDA